MPLRSFAIWNVFSYSQGPYDAQIDPGPLIINYRPVYYVLEYELFHLVILIFRIWILECVITIFTIHFDDMSKISNSLCLLKLSDVAYNYNDYVCFTLRVSVFWREMCRVMADDVRVFFGLSRVLSAMNGVLPSKGVRHCQNPYGICLIVVNPR